MTAVWSILEGALLVATALGGIVGGIGVSIRRSALPRDLVEPIDASPAHLGPWHNCPQCGAFAQRCSGCGETRTDRKPHEVHERSPDGIAKRCGSFTQHPDVFLNYTSGTSMQRLCTPQRRVRLSWFGPRCAITRGMHVHQRCERCGWKGIAPVGKMAP